MNFDLKAALLAAQKLVARAAELGVAADVALAAFIARLYPDEAVVGSTDFSEAMQEAVDDAVEASQVD